jgi:hypothetical protein
MFLLVMGSCIAVKNTTPCFGITKVSHMKFFSRKSLTFFFGKAGKFIQIGKYKVREQCPQILGGSQERVLQALTS